MSGVVLREHTGAVATIELNRPAALNAAGNMHLTQTSDFKEAVAAWLQQSGQPRRE